MILDIASNTKLASLVCDDNQISNLDVSNNKDLMYPIILEYPGYYTMMNISNMPSLTQVCVWELPFPPEGRTNFQSEGSPN